MLLSQEDADRLIRLRTVQETFQAEDEHAGGGQQTNLLLQLQREAKGKAAQKAAALAAQKQEEAAKKAKKEQREAEAREAEGAEPAEDMEEEEDPVMASFKRAAQIIKEKQEEDKMSIDQRIYK